MLIRALALSQFSALAYLHEVLYKLNKSYAAKPLTGDDMHIIKEVPKLLQFALETQQMYTRKRGQSSNVHVQKLLNGSGNKSALPF